MGDGKESLTLTATCPKCGKSIKAIGLAALRRELKYCCRTRSARMRAASVEPATDRIVRPVDTPVKFRFERQPLSQNRTTYAHWTAHHRDKRSWMEECRVKLAALHGLRLAWSSWVVRRVYGGRHREMDYANLVGGCKPLIDCLTELAIIVDDSPSHFKCEYIQERGTETYTVLTLQETGDARHSP